VGQEGQQDHGAVGRHEAPGDDRQGAQHEPTILFLDEPTAGVDVELRRDMWQMVRALRESGVTIILTTHYIEEAEEMADRIGVISKGEIILVEDKTCSCASWARSS
jgi:ABC-type multidrug transport system ATPase subunit